MSAGRVARLLHDRAAGRRSKHSLPSTSMVIRGGRMTPTGCDAALSLVQWEKTEDVGGTRRAKALRHHRVTLPQLPPGCVLQAPQRYYECVRRGHVLPPANRCAVRDAQTGRRVSLTPLPCSQAVKQTCARCPWMAAGTHLSADSKAEVLRECMDAAVTARDSAEGLRPFFLEPFPVRPTANHLQELTQFYTPLLGECVAWYRLHDVASASGIPAGPCGADLPQGLPRPLLSVPEAHYKRLCGVRVCVEVLAAHTSIAVNEGGGEQLEDPREEKETMVTHHADGWDRDYMHFLLECDLSHTDPDTHL